HVVDEAHAAHGVRDTPRARQLLACGRRLAHGDQRFAALAVRDTGELTQARALGERQQLARQTEALVGIAPSERELAKTLETARHLVELAVRAAVRRHVLELGPDIEVSEPQPPDRAVGGNARTPE